MKKGRPSKFNEAVKDTMIRLYRGDVANGIKPKTDEQVAEIIGVNVRTLHNWKGKYTDFLHSMKNAKSIADELMEASLWSRGMGYTCKETKVLVVDDKIEKVSIDKHYPPDTGAAKFWLKNRRPQAWRENWEPEITPPPQPETEKSKLTDKALDERIAQLNSVIGITNASSKKEG
jgi:hypothetical protein